MPQLEPRPPIKLIPLVGRYHDGSAEVLFVKSAARWPRMISGLASSDKIVSDTCLVTAGCITALPLPLFWEHQEEIGQVVFLRRSATGIFIRARLYSAADDAWSAVNYGRAVGLSVRTCDRELTIEKSGVKFYGKWRLEEISICRTPMNADCRLSIYRPS